MRPRKIIAMVMTFLMMLSLLPSLVFAAAAPEGELGGQLKIKGTAAVGSELSADYEKVTPEGLTDDYVTFSWSRKVGDQLTEVGTEKTYKLVDEAKAQNTYTSIDYAVLEGSSYTGGFKMNIAVDFNYPRMVRGCVRRPDVKLIPGVRESFRIQMLLEEDK